MKKGDISNQRAYGVGVDVSVMLTETPPTKLLDKLFKKKAWKISEEGRRFAEATVRRGLRVVLFIWNCSDGDFNDIILVTDLLPIQVVRCVDDLELGNEALNSVDVFFTTNEDFYEVWRYFKNVRLWRGLGEANNYLRYFE